MGETIKVSFKAFLSIGIVIELLINIFSICMRMKNTAAPATDDYSKDCSCAHGVPQKCDDKVGEPSDTTDISMTTYSMCYLGCELFLKSLLNPTMIADDNMDKVGARRSWTGTL